jgi:hypothetical protein
LLSQNFLMRREERESELEDNTLLFYEITLCDNAQLVINLFLYVMVGIVDSEYNLIKLTYTLSVVVLYRYFSFRIILCVQDRD